MLLPSSEIAERDRDRAMLQDATERFLSEGNNIERLEGFAPVPRFDAKKAYRNFSVSPPKPTVRPQKEPSACSDALAQARSMKAPTEARSAAYREKRAKLAVTVARYAKSGMGLSETAQVMSVTRNYIRRIAKEHNITFNKQTA